MRLNMIKVKVGKNRYKPTKISLSAFNKRVKSGNMKHDYNEYYKSGGKTFKRTYAHNVKPLRRKITKGGVKYWSSPSGMRKLFKLWK